MPDSLHRSAGGTFIFWVADWFALMNDKMGGDLEKIKVVGEYLVEVWKATGMDMERVKFVWSSDDITNKAVQYWTQALDIARRTTLARVKKCCQIMGRLENKLTAAQILYPLMQCTDIFFLKADICQLGVDQRKVLISPFHTLSCSSPAAADDDVASLPVPRACVPPLSFPAIPRLPTWSEIIDRLQIDEFLKLMECGCLSCR